MMQIAGSTSDSMRARAPITWELLDDIGNVDEQEAVHQHLYMCTKRQLDILACTMAADSCDSSQLLS